MDALKRMGGCGIIPLVVLDRVTDAVPTAKALLAGGAEVMEIALRTEASLECIRAVVSGCPDIIIGAGTVVSLEQCQMAVDAGANFIVSPGFSREVVEWCLDNGVAVTPGCVTPTEITSALGYGINVLKFFPANVFGGLSAMAALSGPFGNVKFIPTGGVGPENMREFVSAPFVFAVGGSWLCTRKDIYNGNFDLITDLTAHATKVVKNCRS